MLCPSCGTEGSGNYCANCAAPLAGAACLHCRSPLTPGAKFCHRCGTPVGTQGLRPQSTSNALPWSVAGIALLAMIALVAGQRFGRSRASSGEEQPATPPPSMAGRAPDISAMSPTERAERLYDRVMSAAERGKTDSVRFFLPMAMQSYADLGPLSVDQRYDLGRLAEVGGDAKIAAAQADTILRENPVHLLGLILASRAARMKGNQKAADAFLDKMAAAEPAERKKAFPEYAGHGNDIDTALKEYRARTGK